jgi:hypothetical protein
MTLSSNARIAVISVVAEEKSKFREARADFVTLFQFDSKWLQDYLHFYS